MVDINKKMAMALGSIPAALHSEPLSIYLERNPLPAIMQPITQYPQDLPTYTMFPQFLQKHFVWNLVKSFGNI